MTVTWFTPEIGSGAAGTGRAASLPMGSCARWCRTSWRWSGARRISRVKFGERFTATDQSPQEVARACADRTEAGDVAASPSATAAGAQDGYPGRRVLRTTVEGPITPVIVDHLAGAVARAEDDGYGALVVEVDTPGGLDESMRDIVQGFLAAEVPVVAYVNPQGARAGSAGALIALSAHVAAMAPGTAIGASTPVSLDGAEGSDKVVNDAAAFAEAIAERRGGHGQGGRG